MIRYKAFGWIQINCQISVFKTFHFMIFLNQKKSSILLSSFLVLTVFMLCLSSCKEKKLSATKWQYVKTTVAESLGEESMVTYPGEPSLRS